MTTLRAHFDGRVLVPDQPVDLPLGQPLEVQVRSIGEPTQREQAEPPGSPQALLRALRESTTPVDHEAVEEMNRAIEEGKLPVNDRGIFDEQE